MSRPTVLRGILLATLINQVVLAAFAYAQSPRQVLEARFAHLRSGSVREWSSFPAQAESDHLETRFSAKKNTTELTLRLRQHDVKQAWRVLLNGKALGELIRDENDQILYLPISVAALNDGENVLSVEPSARAPAITDDIRVGEIWIEPQPRATALAEATLMIHVTDADTGTPTPARITITNSDGSLQALGISSSDNLAVRTGVVYTADGNARISVPQGKYRVYAGRGFEYSLNQTDVAIRAGETVERTLAIRREVPTGGYVACDTHIHTLTHSGHGDASIAERMITLAGEGIELPIATDHNVQIDYQSHAERLAVRQYFTPVVGNEVTTAVGHFNIFPTAAKARIPDFKQKSWSAIFDEIFSTEGIKIAILNHARDLHGGTRPFGPKLFNAAIGDNIDNWPMRFNAMEIINSGATQTDPLRLIKDWMSLLNRGYRVTPIGSSDSHDVSRYIVGQGRTYIRADDRDPANIDVAAAVDNLLQGRVLVSYGLLVEAIVNDKYRSGDFAQLAGDEVKVNLRLSAPSWSRATQLLLFGNGSMVTTINLAGISHVEHTLTLPRPKHDVCFVAVALGPGIENPHWPTAKPYQPASPDWQPYVLGVSSPIWLDGDGDGRQSTPREYAEQLVANCHGDAAKVCTALTSFDAATTAQAAHLLRLNGQSLDAYEIFRPYLDAWRENERARAEP